MTVKTTTPPAGSIQPTRGASKTTGMVEPRIARPPQIGKSTSRATTPATDRRLFLRQVAFHLRQAELWLELAETEGEVGL